MYMYKVEISHCYHQSTGDCPTFSVPSISSVANKVTYIGNLCHKETKSTINVGLGRGWYWIPPWFASSQISLELEDHGSYKVFLFPRGWFYDKRTQQKLEFIDVRKGEHVNIQLSLQVKSSLLNKAHLPSSKCKRSTLTTSTAKSFPTALPTANQIQASTTTRRVKKLSYFLK